VRIVSFADRLGRSRVGVLVATDRISDVTDSVPTTPGLSPIRRALSLDAFAERIAEAVSASPELSLEEVDLQPIVPDPTKIIAAPVNFVDHKAEMSEESQVDGLGVFLKAPSSVLAHGGVVQLPYTDRRFDQEGEFAVVIARTVSHARIDEALDYVAGYTSLLDMTMRGGEDRSVRKSFDTFTPVGPSLITPDELPTIGELVLRCWVNGDLRQQAPLRDLIWDVPRLISYASSVMTLYPGDVLTTGTPAGVGAVGDGDVIEVEISGLDRLRVSVSAAGAGPCPTRGAGHGPKPPVEQTPIRP